MIFIKKIKMGKVVLLFFAMFLFLNIISISANARVQKKVLVLHSYHKGLSWTDRIISGIESAFKISSKEGYDFALFVEYMDTKRFVDDSYYEQLKNFYKYKSKKVRYDVIISADDNALNFLLRYRNDIFGKVPVVFCGVNYYKKSLLKGKKQYTGVVEKFDIRSTLNIAIQLHKDTKEFVVIGDSSTTSKKNKLAIREVAPEYEKRGITFKYYNDGDIMRYQRDLQKLKSGSVVIAMLFNRDSDGRFYTYGESFKIYTLNVDVPVYTFWDFYLNKGAMGGMIISGITQGETAANKAIEILKGKSIKKIPVQLKSPNRYMFDYNILKKFEISEYDLPDSSVILNRPKDITDFYKRYKGIIIGIFTFIGFLVIVILILIVNIRRRKIVELELLTTNKSYDRFVPHEFLNRLGKDNITGVKLGEHIEREMTLIFSDIRSFTTLSETMTPQENFEFINDYLKFVSPIIRDNNGYIDKYIGDAIMAVFPDKPEDAVIASIEMQKQVIEFNYLREEKKLAPISIGVALHTDNFLLGTIGEEERMEGAVISDSVPLVDRLEGLTKMFGVKILITGNTLEKLGKRKEKYLVRYFGRYMIVESLVPVEFYELIESNTARVVELKMKTLFFFEKAVYCFQNGEFDDANKYIKTVVKINPDDLAVKFIQEQIQKYIGKDAPKDWNGVIDLDNNIVVKKI